jgi:hypothetical protein
MSALIGIDSLEIAHVSHDVIFIRNAVTLVMRATSTKQTPQHVSSCASDLERFPA